MDELIKEIINIEERAQAVIADARTAKRELSQRVTLDSIKMQNDIERQAKEKNAAIRQMETDETEKKISEINEKTEKAMSALEGKYRENKEKWVEKMVNSIIGG